MTILRADYAIWSTFTIIAEAPCKFIPAVESLAFRLDFISIYVIAWIIHISQTLSYKKPKIPWPCVTSFAWIVTYQASSGIVVWFCFSVLACLCFIVLINSIHLYWSGPDGVKKCLYRYIVILEFQEKLFTVNNYSDFILV